MGLLNKTAIIILNILIFTLFANAEHDDENGGGKCGLGTVFSILEQYQQVSEATQKEIARLLEPPTRHKWITKGFFKIIFDTIGTNTPSTVISGNKRVLADTSIVRNRVDSTRVIMEFVDSTANIFNYVYDQIVNQFGYTEPPFETGNTHNIYITEFDGGLYGQTIPNPNPINPNENPLRYTSYVEIDNDFKDVYPSSRGIPGLKVTAAHEFHHMVQLGSYGYRHNDRYFYEITSTWIEDAIYDEINDYYQYLKSSSGTPRGHFADPGASFIKTDGFIEYSRAIWGIYLEKKFSRNIIRKIWELIRSFGSIRAMEDALVEVNFNFQQLFIEFSKWNYFTGSRAIAGSYYNEASEYPLIELKTPIEIIGSTRDYTGTTETVSSIYLPIIFKGTQFTTIVSNLNLIAASAGTINNHPFTLKFSTSNDGTFKEIYKDLYVKFNVSDINNWTINAMLAAEVSGITVFPNPFIHENRGTIQFLLPKATQNAVSMYIYSSDMSLVYSNDYFLSTFEPRIVWDAKDNKGNYLGSGVYIYTILIDQKEHVGKLAIVRK